jgi:hypothetical protein
MTMLDLTGPDMDAAFSVAPLYVKTAVVTVREVPPGTEVTTRLADGTVETVKISDEVHRFEVTNPGGEKYLITGEKLAARYHPIGNGMYRARGSVRAFRNPTGGPITITAPWGEEQHGGPDAMLAVAVDFIDPAAIGPDRYIIGADEFAKTYGPAPVGTAH